MNTMLNSFGLFLVLLSSPSWVVAQASPGKINIPASQWEPQAGVINFAIELTTAKRNTTGGFICVFIKNTSASRLALVVSSSTDQGFDIFTVDNSGKHILHDHDPYHGLGTRAQEIAAQTRSEFWQQIDPGRTMSCTIEVSPGDLALIKASPVQCKFLLINPDTGQSYKVESAPKLLTSSP